MSKDEWDNLMARLEHKRDTPEYQRLVKLRESGATSIEGVPLASLVKKWKNDDFKAKVDVLAGLFIEITGANKGSLVLPIVDCYAKSAKCNWAYIREEWDANGPILSARKGKCSTAEVFVDGKVLIDGQPLFDPLGHSPFTTFVTWTEGPPPHIITAFKVDLIKK